jgi:hypothetical protein
MPVQSVRTIRRLLAGALLLLGLAATVLMQPGAAAAADPAPTTPVANRIELLRTGGVTGVPVTFTVEAGNVGDDGAKLLRLVATPEFLALAPSYGPKNPCCDFFIYTLTVTYDGGATKTVFTSDAAEDAPAILFTVIRTTERIGSTGAER